MSHETYVQQCRKKIGKTASAMIAGRVSFIEGARHISALRFEAELEVCSSAHR